MYPMGSKPIRLLIVDDNRDLLHFLERLMAEAGWELHTAESESEGRAIAAKWTLDAALLDYMLPDGNGLELAHLLKQQFPQLQIILMTGAVLSPEDEAVCEELDIPVLRKPFLATDVMNQLRGRLIQRAVTPLQ